MNRKFHYVLLFALLVVASARGQTLSNRVAASGGHFSQGGWGSISATIGEPIINTLETTNLNLLQGFQQLDELQVGVVEKSFSNLSASIYPNPTSNAAWLQVTMPKDGRLVYRITDLLGQELELGNMTCQAGQATAKSLTFSSYKSGIYLVSLYSNSEMMKTFRLQIIH